MREMDAATMEPLARVLAGYDAGEKRRLTEDEREWLAHDADQMDPAFPYAEGIARNDAELCDWWLDAMRSYVWEMFGV